MRCFHLEEVALENKAQDYAPFFPICYERGMRRMQFAKRTAENYALSRDTGFHEEEKLSQERKGCKLSKPSAVVDVVWRQYIRNGVDPLTIRK